MRKVWMTLALCASLNAYAEEAMTGAFNDGKELGSTSKDENFSEITTNTAKKVIPAYGQNAPESAYFQGGNGNTSGLGLAKLQACETNGSSGTAVQRQECEAVNFLAKNPNVRPQLNISKNDALIKKTRDIQGSAEDIFGSIGQGGNTACVTKTVTTPAQYETNTCINLSEAEAQQCTMGREIDINADSNFQCKQTINTYESYSCNKRVTVSATPGSTTTTTQTVCDSGNFVAYGSNGRDSNLYGWLRCVNGVCKQFCLQQTYWLDGGGTYESCYDPYAGEGPGTEYPLSEINAGMDTSISCGKYYTTSLNGLTLTKYGIKKNITIQNPPVITTSESNGCATFESRAQ